MDEAVGGNPRILKSGEQPDEFYKDLWDTITSGKEWHGTFHNKKKSGELYWESATIAPVRDKNGTIISFIAIKKDITEQRQAEDEREQLIVRLQDALETVKKIECMIPICASCKENRDDQ